MTALPDAMATRNGVLTTVKALERALRQAEFDRPASDTAPLSFRPQGYMPVDDQAAARVKISRGDHVQDQRSDSCRDGSRQWIR